MRRLGELAQHVVAAAAHREPRAAPGVEHGVLAFWRQAGKRTRPAVEKQAGERVFEEQKQLPDVVPHLGRAEAPAVVDPLGDFDRIGAGGLHRARSDRGEDCELPLVEHAQAAARMAIEAGRPEPKPDTRSTREARRRKAPA